MAIRLLLAVVFVGAGLLAMQGRAAAETRSLKIYNVHTGEKAVIAYKRDGRYVRAGLKRLDYILRDWRKDQEIDMDPRLMDLLWEVYRKSGSSDYIHIICGYRTADTNAMLRGRSRASGVAKKSQHILGKAADFFIPDVQLERLREIGMKFQIGGVGYYPNSGSPFVHMDTGFVRAWPRMSREQLVRLFPDGRTLHLPRDGKPLSGYQAALASYKRRVSDDSIVVAGGSAGRSRSGNGNLLAALFGGGGGKAGADAGDTVQASATPRQIEAAAMATAEPAVLLPAAANAPLPGVRPTLLADAAPEPAPVARARGSGGGDPPSGASRYPNLVAYAAPLPQLPPPAGARAATTAVSAEATGSVSVPPDGSTPVPGMRPELVAFAEPSDDVSAPAPAAVGGSGRRELKAADIAASARRELTTGAILMASLGPIPVVRSHVPAKSRTQKDFASVQGEEIKGGRLDAAERTARAAKARLTREMIREWAMANRRGRIETVADSTPARRMQRLAPAAPDRRNAAGHRVDPQRFAALTAYFRQD